MSRCDPVAAWSATVSRRTGRLAGGASDFCRMTARQPMCENQENSKELAHAIGPVSHRMGGPQLRTPADHHGVASVSSEGTLNEIETVIDTSLASLRAKLVEATAQASLSPWHLFARSGARRPSSLPCGETVSSGRVKPPAEDSGSGGRI
jgi:hypothetical protein